MSINRKSFTKTASCALFGVLALSHPTLAAPAPTALPYGYLIDYGDSFQSVTIVGSIKTTFPPVLYSDGRATNQNVYQPGSPQYQTLTFQRRVDGNRYLWDWFKVVREGQNVQKNITVFLLDQTLDPSNPIQTWTLFNCIPITIKQIAVPEGLHILLLEEVTVQAERIESL